MLAMRACSSARLAFTACTNFRTLDRQLVMLQRAVRAPDRFLLRGVGLGQRTIQLRLFSAVLRWIRFCSAWRSASALRSACDCVRRMTLPCLFISAPPLC